MPERDSDPTRTEPATSIEPPAAVTPPAAHPATRRAQFARGVQLGLPILLGYLPVGMAFGVIAADMGFTLLQAITCSATALAGAGQFIALAQMRAGEGLLGVLAATTIVNLRYVLFGATMSSYLRGMPLHRQAALAFTLTDETFAVNINDHRPGRATGWSMAGVGAISWTGWVTGTAIGAGAASLILDPSRYGVEFAMPAMFTALFVALAEDRRHVMIGLLAGAIALALPALATLGIEISSAWFIILASTVAATIGTVVYRAEEKPS